MDIFVYVLYHSCRMAPFLFLCCSVLFRVWVLVYWRAELRLAVGCCVCVYIHACVAATTLASRRLFQYIFEGFHSSPRHFHVFRGTQLLFVYQHVGPNFVAEFSTLAHMKFVDVSAQFFLTNVFPDCVPVFMRRGWGTRILESGWRRLNRRGVNFVAEWAERRLENRPSCIFILP